MINFPIPDFTDICMSNKLQNSTMDSFQEWAWGKTLKKYMK